MERFDQLRVLEAILFASSEPVSEKVLQGRLPEGSNLKDLLEELKGFYSNRGVHLVSVGKRAWAFRTAPDLSEHLRIDTTVKRRLSRAAVETLAIIAYHQPITRAEIEEVRGVSTSKGTLDTLLAAEWIRPVGRRRVPGRPVTWGTTEQFLDQFAIEKLEDLPGIDELKAAGLLDTRPGLMSLGKISDGSIDAEEEDKDDDELDLSPEEERDLLDDFLKEEGPSEDDSAEEAENAEETEEDNSEAAGEDELPSDDEPQETETGPEDELDRPDEDIKQTA